MNEVQRWILIKRKGKWVPVFTFRTLNALKATFGSKAEALQEAENRNKNEQETTAQHDNPTQR